MATTQDLERELGGQFRSLRLAQDVDQKTLAREADVGLSALKNLESGRGTSLKTVIRVARALGQEEWLRTFYPEPDVSPMELLRAQRGAARPQRASRRR